MANRLPEVAPVISGYHQVRALGTGGFADVFLYEQDLPRRQVAVKVLLSGLVDSQVTEQFNAEADTMAKLGVHPSAISIFEASISNDGRPYIVMEYCPKSYDKRYRTEVFSVPEILNVGVRIAGALETAHRSGVLHRDIKPGNILITKFGTPVLADFGIAATLSSIANLDIVALSLPWSAPEIVDETVVGSVPAEVYSLAATLYTLLAGRSPHEVPGQSNNTEALSKRIKQGKIPEIARQDIPPQLQDLLMLAMSKDPAKRPQNMLSFAQKLQEIQQQLGLPVSNTEVGEVSYRTERTPESLAASRGPVQSVVETNNLRKKPIRKAAATPSAMSNKLKTWLIVLGITVVAGGAFAALLLGGIV